MSWLSKILDALRGKTPMADTPSWQELLPTAPRTFFAGAKDLVFSNTPGLVLRDAWNLAELSILAYWNASGIKAISAQLDPHRWTLQTFVRGNSTDPEAGPIQAVLAVSEKTAILAFRGTRLRSFPGVTEILQLASKAAIDFGDLGIDLNFKLDAEGVHTGIHSSFNDWLMAFGDKVGPFLQGKERVYITGHSLGGALAGLAARAWKDLGNVSLHTFGAPRYCNEPYRAGFVGLPVYRFVFGSDFVTSVLPQVDVLPPALRFVHVGDIHLLDANGVAAGDHQPDLRDVLVDTVLGAPVTWLVNAAGLFSFPFGQLFNPRIRAGALTNHAPRFYADALQRAAALP